jgi:5'-phosphate synthase pdxT subunit
MKIGVLDIQGSVEEHILMLKKCGVVPVSVKRIEDLREVRGLIIPGGESTTIGKLLKRFGLFDEIIKRARSGMVIWGTCAGAILLAKNVIGQKGKIAVDNLRLMDITVERNAYGRQIDSFETDLDFDFGKVTKKIPAVFIRAPKIVNNEKTVKILANHEGEIVAAIQGKLLATTFHPEMTGDLSVHKLFIGMCK